jgi:hypothetical protein
MAPKKKAPRCAYHEHGERCRRAGTGNPPVCDAHRIVLDEATRAKRPGSTIFGIVAELFQGKRSIEEFSEQELYAGVSDFIDVAQRIPSDRVRAAAAGAQARAEQVRAWQRAQRGQAEAPRQEGPDVAVIKARAVLGFGPREPLTPPAIKQRHRDLARKNHPDRGGSVARMQEINAAVDVVLASL